jgi:hypothetical protein
MIAPGKVAADLDAWVARLESEPEWTAGMRRLARVLGLRASDLVLLIARPDEYPRARPGATIVHGFLVRVGRASEVPDALPSALRASMGEAERRAHPGHSHALIFSALGVDSVRFRVPPEPAD